MVKKIWWFWWIVGMFSCFTSIFVCSIGQMHPAFIAFCSWELAALCFGFAFLMDNWNVLNEGSL